MSAAAPRAFLTGQRAFAYALILAAMMAVAAGITLTARLRESAADPTGRAAGTDFVTFVAAGRMVAAGRPAQAYDPAETSALQHRLARLPAGFLPFYYPPPLLAMCALVAALPWGIGWLAWMTAGGLPLLRALRRTLPQRWAWLPLLGFPAFWLNTGSGQTGFFPAAALAMAAVWLDRRPAAAGAALSLLIVKPHLAIAAPLALAAAGRGRALAAFLLTCLFLCAVTWIAFGTATWAGFLASLPRAGLALRQDREDWSKLLSLYTALRLFGASAGGALAAQAAAGMAVLGVLLHGVRARPGAGAEMALLAAAALLLSPHVMDYDLCVLAPPLAWLLAAALRDGFLPGERALLAAAYVFPLCARVLTFALHLPLGPVLLALVLAAVARRAARIAP